MNSTNSLLRRCREPGQRSSDKRTPMSPLVLWVPASLAVRAVTTRTSTKRPKRTVQIGLRLPKSSRSFTCDSTTANCPRCRVLARELIDCKGAIFLGASQQLTQFFAAAKVIPPGSGPTGTLPTTFRLTGSITETVLANVFEIKTRSPLLLTTTP